MEKIMGNRFIGIGLVLLTLIGALLIINIHNAAILNIVINAVGISAALVTIYNGFQIRRSDKNLWRHTQ